MNSVETSAFLLPRGWKAVFEAFSPFPRDWKTVLRLFPHFQGVGKPFLRHFPISKGLENRFEALFQFRPWPKRCFCCFLLFGHGRKPIFSVFCPSYPYERLFLPFFIDCTPTKRGFSRFLLVVGVRKTVFRRFSHFVGRR